ncbi:FxsA family protein [Acinetobacter sp. 187]|uniref:FxsA family protein n=1 Tax=Acinetobacter lanii TaxID=2715163 RepID=A0A6G8S3H8_9GAMM|nr:FxsA family protein [Acinetobacter lanii]NHC03221.1 FxsA family protein [Acinetobacter lanii]QIO08722.1 FxsA family protein [Acinetobacter lanii]
MKIALIVLIGLILEIFVWIGVGDLVGSMWYVFFWFVAAFFIGSNLIRAHASGLQQMKQGGAMALDPSMTNNLPKIIAGILLIIPGLITDVLALLILIPPVQQALKAVAMKTLMKRQQAMMEKMMGGMMGGMGNMGGADAQGQNPFADLMRQMQEAQQGGQRGGRDSNVIDGEAREVTPDAKKIEFKDVK